MQLNIINMLFLSTGFIVNFIAIIILIGKMGSFIGRVDITLKHYEKRLDKLEGCLFK